MAQILLQIDFEDFCNQVLASPGVGFALSCGDLLPIKEADMAQLYRACMDFIVENPEPYLTDFGAMFPLEDLRVEVAVVQTAYGINLAKALWAAQLPRILETGNFLDVSRLSDADLIALYRAKLQ